MENRKKSKLLALFTGLITAASCIGLMPAAPASAAKLLGAEFETTNDSFTGRATESVQWTSDEAYQGTCSLFVSDRASTWNGACRDVNTLMKAGQTYKISAAVLQKSGLPMEMKMSMQCKIDGETTWPEIATVPAESGEWTILSNEAFTVPEGATDMSIYVETTETDTELIDFYVDSVEIHGSPAKIKIGDVNGDLLVDLTDVDALVKALTTESDEFDPGADLNEDSIVNSADLSILKDQILNPPPPPETTPGAEVSGDWDNYQETASEQMLKAYKGSLLRMGNTSRIREKIARAQSGENVTIGYIGGSITEGGSSTSPDKSYVSISGNYFKDTFGTGNNVSFVNAGKAGTSSVVGNMRVDTDIFAKNCDVIFIEFAVNDQGGDRFTKSYEALVKKCLMQENAPAVILITLCQKSLGTNEDWMAKVGENYDLAVISGKGAIQGGNLDWDSQYGSGDTIHPGNGGHQIIADCIGYYYRQALRSENETEPYVIPESEVYGAEYANNHPVDITQLPNFSAGSWTRGGDGSFKYSKNGNDPLHFTVEGKGILLMFQSNSKGMGTVNVTANGNNNKVTSNLQWTWGGQDGDVGYYQPNSGTLDIDISSADGGTFVLYGVWVIE